MQKINFQLEDISREIRINIIKTSFKAKVPHLGSCLSCVELLVYLYWIELNIDPLKCNEINRDKFILSKGHGVPALFQVLAMKKFFPMESLNDYGKNGSLFHEHPPKPGLIPGIEAATGSLGHGFPMSLGMALSAKIKGLESRVYALLSDGECNEGSIWEAALLAASQKMNNLTAIIDFNKWQATGRSEDILSLSPLKLKWESFGWNALEINGHNFNEISKAFKKAKNETKKPTVIIANTIKGKGVSFMEDNNNWHYRVPNEEEFNKAIQELGVKK